MDYQEKFYRDVFFPTLRERDIKVLMDLGDTFDRRKYVNFLTLKRAYEMYFDPLVELGVEVHSIVGNHTVYHRNSNDINFELTVRQYKNYNVYTHEPKEVVIDGAKILMVPWITSDNQGIAEEALRTTDAKVVMGHFEIEGFEMHRGSLCTHGMSMPVFSRFDSVFSGHFHHKSSYRNIHYLGAPYEMTWSDYNDPRGFHIYDTDTGRLEFIRNPYSMFHQLRYNDEGLRVEELDQLDLTGLKDTYIKVVVEKKTNPYIFDLFLDRIQQVGAASVKIVEDVSAQLSNEEEVVDETQDTVTILNRYIESVELDFDKNRLSKFIGELYQEALNVE